MSESPFRDRQMMDNSEVDTVTREVLNDAEDGGFPWDTSDPFFSAHARDVLKMVFKCYIRQIIIFLGVPGNFVCCVVFLKQGLSDRITLLLFSLALADVLNLATQLLFLPACYLQSRDPLQAGNWDTVANVKVVYVNRWVSFVSGTLIVVLSVDRCLSVVFPLKAARILTYRPMLAAIISTYVIHFVCYFPSMLVYAVRWRVDPSTNRSLAYTAINEGLLIDNKISEAYTTVFHLLMKPISITTVVVCCSITIVHLHRASRRRQQLKGGRKGDPPDASDTRITKMLLFLCIAYVVLVLPELSASVTYSVVPGFFLYQKYHNSFTVLFEVVIFNASCLNSAINFFAYVLLSSKFRTTLRELCQCRRRGKR